MHILHLLIIVVSIEWTEFSYDKYNARDFASMKDKLDRGLKRILHKIDMLIHGHPSILWTGNGYHIYQPMEGFVLEEEERFARLVDPAAKI